MSGTGIDSSHAALLDALGMSALLVDEHGLVSSLNSAAQRLTGWTREEALGQPLVKIWQTAPVRLNTTSRDLASAPAVSPADVHRGLAVASCKDGRTVPIEWRSADEAGLAPGMKLVVFWEATPLNDMLIGLDRLAAIVESSSDAIISKTLEGVVTSWNQGAERLFGYTAQEMVGQPIRLLFPADRQHEEDGILQHIRSGQRVPPFDTQRLRKDGSLIDVSVTISPIHGADGRIVGASKIVRDNAERIRRQKLESQALQLEAANLQMVEAGRLRSTYFAKMSHELRTPLNAIIGFAQLLLLRPSAQHDERLEQSVRHILRGGQHVLQLVNEVLDLAKLESGHFSFHPEPVYAAQMVNEVASILEPLFLERHVELATQVDASLGELLLDPLRFKQILYNYLSNAVKFSPDKGLVKLQVRAEGPTHLRLEVSDQGPGVPAAQQSSLFADFVQLSTASPSSDGTGLGLSLTRTLVEAQGGSVGVESEAGKGATFFAVLPRRRPPEDGTEQG